MFILPTTVGGVREKLNDRRAQARPVLHADDSNASTFRPIRAGDWDQSQTLENSLGADPCL